MHIAVIGSINTDITIHVPHHPQRNETVVGHGNYVVSQGGKGANQAAAAAAAGATVHMIGRVGEDDFGTRALEDLVSLGVDCRGVRRSAEHSTGLATIHVDPHGDNSICVAPGANAALSPQDVLAAREIIARCDIVMLQLEIPQETMEFAVQLARKLGARVLLDPAPAPQHALECLSAVDFLTPNEIEAEAMTGINPDSPAACAAVAQRLFEQGASTIVLTLGSRGSFLASPAGSMTIPAYRVRAVDTTGAGDVFSGFFACALARGLPAAAAAQIAAAAAAVAVTRAGARANLPRWAEVEAFRLSH